jgi:hypothetical protein
MERALMFAGFGLLASAAGYAVYTTIATAPDIYGIANVPGLLLTLGIVLSIGGAALQQPRQRGLGRWLRYAGCAFVAAYVIQALYASASVLAQDTSPGNVFNAVGMLGMLLALGGSALQSSRA